MDVTAILETLNEKNPQMLDWRKSIVDLIKLLARDGSLTTRKKFASKVHYTGASEFRVDGYLATQGDYDEDRRQ